MAAWSRLPQEVPNAVVLFVSATDDRSLLAECPRGSKSMAVLIDAKRLTAQRYNARWQPRAYGIDEQGTLVYVQSETTLDPQGPVELERLWQGT